MPRYSGTAVTAGRIGGLTRSALCPDNTAHTLPARQARFERYRAMVRAALPDLADEAEIDRRAEMLRTADMTRLSARAATKRRQAAEARRQAAAIEAEMADLDATGLDQTGSDGIDL